MKAIRPAILCGGSGERLWPLSRRTHPKPFHALVSGRTLFEETVLRSSGAGEGVNFSAPLIIGGLAIANAVDTDLASCGVAAEAVALEPAGRNTAAAAVIAARMAQACDGEDALVLLAPSDHHITPLNEFRASVAKAAALAEAGKIVVFGIAPTRPETGYGYIRSGDALDGGLVVEAFEEKPDLETAQRYLAEGTRYWNAGLFAFRADVLIVEMQDFEPDIVKAMDAALAAAKTSGNRMVLDKTAFETAPSVPLDIAVMERTAHAAMVPASFGWSDIGAWGSLSDFVEPDHQGVRGVGSVTAVDCQDTYLRGEGIHVAALGVNGLVVVATPDAVFVSSTDRSGDVKALIAEIREAGRDELL